MLTTQVQRVFFGVRSFPLFFLQNSYYCLVVSVLVVYLVANLVVCVFFCSAIFVFGGFCCFIVFVFVGVAVLSLCFRSLVLFR